MDFDTESVQDISVQDISIFVSMAEGTNLRTDENADKHLPSVCAGQKSVKSGVLVSILTRKGLFTDFYTRFY